MNIVNWLYDHCVRNPEWPALYVGTELRANYREFAIAAYALGQRLKKDYQCNPGDRVVIYSKNSLEYLLAMQAIWWIGCVASPVNYRLHPKELEWVLEDTEAKLVITADGNLQKSIHLEQCKEFALSDLNIDELLLETSQIEPPCRAELDDLAWLFYTSGTTGRPKGVMLTHQNLMAMSLCVPIDVHPINHDDATYYAAPLSHGAGLYNFIFTRVGAKHVFPKSGGFDEAELIHTAKTIKNLCFFAAPTILKRLTQFAEKHQYFGEGIKMIVCGGAPLYVADYLASEKQLGSIISQIYGQGESPMTITAISQNDLKLKTPEEKLAYIQTVGTTHSCVQLRVVDEHMNDLPLGQNGEIIVKGLAVMKGYWNNPRATEDTLVDGWLKTGDIGNLNSNGCLTLTDRSKDVIISGGSNVYPREVEEALLHHPAVEEVSVVGVEDEAWGEVVTAHLVMKSDQLIDENELKDWCKSLIAGFKVPKKYFFYEELPKSSYGKIIKAELKSNVFEPNNL